MSKTLKFCSYFLVFAAVVGLVYNGHPTDSIVVAERRQSVSPKSIVADKPSVDQVAASNLAATLAVNADLPIATNLVNQAISVSTKRELAQTSDKQITKPQIVQVGSATSHSITTYKAKRGDTVTSVAKKFNLSGDTIKQSNDLVSDALEAGRKLTIPPVDGLVYKAKPGDTASSIAKKFNTNVQRVVLLNDLELNNAITVGKVVIVPGGRAVPKKPTLTPSYNASFNGINAVPSILASTAAGNRYDYGYCTWYAYNRRAALGSPIGSFWGNASSWAALARSGGFAVNNTPSVGAVMQSSYGFGGYGHVAVVESVKSNGSVMVSEMNFAGWAVKSTRTVPASEVGSYTFIH